MDRSTSFLSAMAIANCHVLREEILRHNVYPPWKVRTIYSGYDPPEAPLSVEKARAALGLRNSEFVLTNIANFRRVKGQLGLLEAAGILKKTLPGFRLLLFGRATPGTDMAEKLRKRVAELALDKHVVFVSQEFDLSLVLAATDAAVSSSWSEGLPMSVIEAMAFGKPVVGTRVGGVPELVIDGKTGYTVSPGDWRALAARIYGLAADRDETRALGAAARERIRRLFSVSQAVHAHEEIYREVRRHDRSRGLSDDS
jgi:glycosyltransferase involved in cell wall biosynthesis